MKARAQIAAAAGAGRAAGDHRLQRRDRRRPADHAGARRIGFLGSILAAALDAAELWIWTDVDGIMSADPRLVPDAQVLDEITYAEAAELAYNGAKVLHPRTLAPLVEKRIPVWSKNSFAPEKPGTRIVPAMASAARRARGDVDGERGAGVAGAGERRDERGAR